MDNALAPGYRNNGTPMNPIYRQSGQTFGRLSANTHGSAAVTGTVPSPEGSVVIKEAILRQSQGNPRMLALGGLAVRQ